MALIDRDNDDDYNGLYICRQIDRCVFVWFRSLDHHHLCGDGLVVGERENAVAPR